MASQLKRNAGSHKAIWLMKMYEANGLNNEIMQCINVNVG